MCREREIERDIIFLQLHNPYKYKTITLKILGFYLEYMFPDGVDREVPETEKE